MIIINGIAHRIIRTRMLPNGDYEHLIMTENGLTYMLEIL